MEVDHSSAFAQEPRGQSSSRRHCRELHWLERPAVPNQRTGSRLADSWKIVTWEDTDETEFVPRAGLLLGPEAARLEDWGM